MNNSYKNLTKYLEPYFYVLSIVNIIEDVKLKFTFIIHKCTIKIGNPLKIVTATDAEYYMYASSGAIIISTNENILTMRFGL